MPPPEFIFFDIETGGLRASRNPVLSLATAGRQGEPVPTYAEPPKGATLSRWSEKKIWEPIKKLGKARTSEKALLMDFLTQLEGAPPNTQLIGWNIGYSPFPQGSTRAGGFDIPVLIERARQYGLDQRYRKAIQKLTIRDEGAIWALRMAKSVAGTTVGKRMVQEGRLQEEIWKEAVGYLKQAGRLAHEQGLKTEAQVAEALSKEGIRFAGWKQESIFKLLFGHTNRWRDLAGDAHEVVADVKMLRMISQETRREFNEEFIERWGREVLENKIVSSLKTVKPGGPARFQEAMQLAKQWGIEEGVTTKLRKLAADSDVSWRAIQAGRGIPQTERVIRGGLAAEAAERIGLGPFSELFEGMGRRHWGKIGLGLGALALVTLKPGNLFSGKDDEYNVIKGLPHGGVAQRMREMFTDFGSGYQGNEKNSDPYLFGIPLAIGGGAAGYFSVYPWEYRSLDLGKYPRLAEMRKIGEKHGFRMLSPGLPSSVTERLPITDIGTLTRELPGRLLWGEMDPARALSEASKFEGVLYVQSGEWSERVKPRAPRVLNWGDWAVGRDKTTTWQFMQNRGISEFHVESMRADQFYAGTSGLSERGKKFIEEAGGLQNIVVKHREAARGQGVWLSAKDLPSDIAEHMFRNQESYLLQKKLDLAEEFRVVTVGDKPIHTTYRFGSPTVRKIAGFLGFTPGKELQQKKVVASPFEIIQPVLDKQVRGRLEEFASRVSKELPYEIGALDIGMTKSGEFKLIEAQRSFGNISNPIVSRRIRNLITGKPGALGAVSAVVGMGLGLAAYNIIFGQDDAYNTIEGLRHEGLAGSLRKENTDFGSGGIRSKLLNRASSIYGAFANKAAQARRTGKVLNWINKENNRAIQNISSEIIRGVRAGQPLEIGVAGFTIGKLGLFTSGVISTGVVAPGSVAATGAAFIATKWGYEAIKKRKLVKEAISLATQYPTETKETVKTASDIFRQQLSEYIKTGKQNYLASYIQAGGGKYGQEVLLGRMESEFGKDWVSNLTTQNFSGFDDAYNIIEGLRHEGMAGVLRKIVTDFGSGWIRKALSKGISTQKIAQVASELGSEGALTQLALERGGHALAAQLKEYRRGMGTTLISNSTGKNQFWVKGEKFGRGGMGEVTKVYGPQGKVGVLKEAGEKSKTIQEALESGALIESAVLTRYKESKKRGLWKRIFDLFSPSETGIEVEMLGKYQRQYSKAISEQLEGRHYIAYEAEMTKKAREIYGDIVPEVYATGERSFVQEFAGTQLVGPTKGQVEFMSTVKEQALSTQSPVLHLDIHKSQILRKGARYQLADWGVAIQQKTGKEVSNLGLSIHRRALVREASIIETVRPELSIPKPDVMEQLVKQVGDITKANRPSSMSFEELQDMSISRAKQLLEKSPTPGIVSTSPDPNKSARLQAAHSQPIGKPPGMMTTASRKDIDTEWESPVNLNKAAVKASKMYKTTPKSVASKQRSSIIEANNAKAKRQQRMQAHHRKAQIQHSSNSLRPGKRHRHQTGRLVT